MKIVVAGASGFVGSALVPFLRDQGHVVIPLVRRAIHGGIFWNPGTKQIDSSRLEGIDVLINLSGENIFGRWSQKKVDRIRESRFLPTQFLKETLLNLKSPPSLYIGASAVGFYGDRGEESLTESSHSGHGYLAEICREWEKISEPLRERGIRVVNARFGIILGKGGGALKKMSKPFRMGLGGVLGTGKQYVSWIALDDLAAAIDFVISHDALSGPINFVAPHPVTNRAMTQLLGKVLKRPTFLPVPKALLSLIFGSGAEIFLDSTRAFPKQLLDGGYTFAFTSMEEALKKYLPVKS